MLKRLKLALVDDGRLVFKDCYADEPIDVGAGDKKQWLRPQSWWVQTLEECGFEVMTAYKCL